MTMLCVTIFAVVQRLLRKAMQNFASLRIDVTTGFPVSVRCEVTIPKWTEWEGDMAGNLLLIF